MKDTLLVGHFRLSDLPDGANPRSWIQIMITNPKDKPFVNGSQEFSITTSDLRGFAADIQARGDSIPIDFDHESEDPDKRTAAAGWYTGGTAVLAQGDQRPNGQGVADRDELWAEVEWTPPGAEAIRSRLYKFISPAFDWFRRTMTGEKVKAHTMASTALTNKPFLKGMAQVTLSDAARAHTGGDPAASDDQEVTMELKDIALSLNLAEDADADAIKAALKAKDDEAKKLADEVTALKAAADKTVDDDTIRKLTESAAKGEKAAKELHDMRRDNLLASAVEKGKILPAQKDRYAAFYDLDPEQTTGLIEELPERSLKARGSGDDGNDNDAGEPDYFVYEDEKGNKAYRLSNDWLSKKADELLAEDGKKNPTAEEKADALFRANAIGSEAIKARL